MGKVVVLFLLVFSSTTLLAQNPDTAFIKNLSEEIMNKSEAYENLRYLCKKIGHRLTGSEGMYKAEDWGLKTMQNYAPDLCIKQACKIVNWKRGKTEIFEIITKAGKQKLNITALGNSLGGNVKNAPIVMLNDVTDLKANADKVKGAIVFFNKAFNNADIRTFVSYSKTGSIRRAGPTDAAKYGALGVVIRSLTHSTDNNPHTGTTQYDSNYAKIPCAAMGYFDANKLAELCKKNSLKGNLITSAYFLPDTIGHNIIAEITGSEFPDKVITIGGHLDSWDLAEGAHDDGAGIVQTMEILRAFKAVGYKPKHTIHFVLFCNEENGLAGGNAYADNIENFNKRINNSILALESDAGGFTPRGFGVTATPEILEKMQAFVPLLKPYGVYEITAGGGGSDISPLLKKFKTHQTSLTPDSQRYFDVHHAKSDIFENVNKRELELGALNMAAFIYLIDKNMFQ
jgi:carboxypeptidase Q